MMTVTRSIERGHADRGWLKSHHTFSFADFHDPKFMGFRTLRVINDDLIAGGTGFGKHPHRDMEIITYVTKGALKHEDTMGNQAVIHAGDVQTLSAGHGMMHSEFNALASESTHLFQIWILPKAPGGAPTYDQRSFASALDGSERVLVVSGDGRDGSIAIKQDADFFVSRLAKGRQSKFTLRAGRGCWAHVASGKVTVNGTPAAEGDAVYTETLGELAIEAIEKSELLIFDLK